MLLNRWIVACALMLVWSSDPPARADEGVADRVTLKDGQILRGEVNESTPRTVVVTARRAWVREHVKEWPTRWEGAETRSLSHALTRRRERLRAWRRDRIAHVAAGDGIIAWIDQELGRLETTKAEDYPLMVIRLSRFDVKQVEPAASDSRSLLRLGWRSGFDRVEEMSTATLTDALTGRGFDVRRAESVSIESLLPPRAESETAWLTRRAATEVLEDAGLRFVRYQGLLLPDTANGTEAPEGIEAVAVLRGLLTGDQADPLPARLRQVEATGRVGILLTRLEIDSSLSNVVVEVGMLVRIAPERWISAGTRIARFRPDDVPGQAGEALAQDPGVAAAFRLVEGLGLGEIAAESKRRSLSVGAAVQGALASARTAALGDLNRLAMPIRDDAPRPGAP